MGPYTLATVQPAGGKNLSNYITTDSMCWIESQLELKGCWIYLVFVSRRVLGENGT